MFHLVRSAARWTSLVALTLALLAVASCRSEAPEPAPTAPTAPAPGADGRTPTSPPAAGVAPTTAEGPRARPSPTPGRVAGLGAASFARASEGQSLTVLTTQPKADAEDVPISAEGSRVLVQFNHPVVPLVGVAEQGRLPVPLTLDPPVQGRGEWLNTSTYVFEPVGLLPSTRYTVTVKPVEDLVGAKLDAPYTFSFTTVYPGVARTGPPDGAAFIAATQPITVTFNQPMSQAEVESAFSLRPEGGPPLAGGFSWDGPTLTFTPAQPLARSTRYTAQLRAGARDAQGKEAMRAAYTWTFQTLPLPALISSKPADGAQASPDIRSGLQLVFSAPMDRDSLKVTIAPTITHQSVYWEDPTNTRARVVGEWKSSTEYTVTVSGQSKAASGETLGQDTVIRFSSAPQEPRFEVHVPGQMAMYDANRPPTIGATTVNVGRLDFRLHTLSASDLLTFLGNEGYRRWDSYQPQADRQARAPWSVSPPPGVDRAELVTTTLTTGPTMAPGAYFLAVSSPQTTRPPARHILIVSDVNLMLKRTDSEALVWATSLRTGQPVPNLPITVYGWRRETLGRGATDADGVFRVQFPVLDEPYTPLFALSERNGQVVAAVGGDWSDGINIWDFQLQGELAQQEWTANLYTERPLYRPGQAVHFKGILRQGRDGAFETPSLETVPISVRDPQGREIYRQQVPVSPYGTFNGDIVLSPAAPLGYYEVVLRVGPEPGPDSQRPQYSAFANFQVLEYRKPEFEVSVASDKAEYINGDTISVTADSAYFFGGPVTDAKVKWRLLADDYYFVPPDTLRGYWEFADSDVLDDRQRRRSGEVIREGTGKTDARGQFTFQAPAALGDYPLSQNYTLEVEATDVNGQAVSSRRVVPVHKGAFYIGIRPERYVATAGQPQRINLIALDTQGISVTNQALTVNVYRREWYSTRVRESDGRFYWTAAHTDTLVSTLTGTTDTQAAASVTYTPPQAGSYRIVAEGRDGRGNTVRSAAYQWVSGREFVAWRVENNDRVGLVADKKTYNAGETARILIPAPFAPAEALLTVERGTIREVRRLSLTSTSTTLDLPLTSDHAPNVYVSVAMVKGGDDKTLPQFKLGYVNLQVTPRDKLLDVTVTADRTGPYAPGQTATYTIVARDMAGRPVQAEFSVAVVDKALLGLVEDRTRTPADVFYSVRPLGVGTAATLVRNVNRTVQQLSPEGKGGGGGGGLEPSPVRRDFRDTAFWEASAVTDEQGRARVSAPLPDNLTTWNVSVKGVTRDTHVGQARLETLVTKELLVRPTLPRFLVQGDTLRLSAVVHNNTDRALDTDVVVQATGLQVRGAPARVSVPSRGRSVVEWDAVVADATEARVTLSAQGGGLQDTVETPLPVYRAASPETVGTAGVVTDRTAEVIQVPAGAAPGVGTLAINVNPSLAAVNADALRYLRGFEWECSEQAVSRFFPNIVNYRTASAMRLPVRRDEIETSMSRDVQRLYSLQNPDGGWGWWSGDPSNPFLTAYAVLGLYTANTVGFAVDNASVERGVAFLRQYLEQPADRAVPGMLSQRAFVLFVMAETGRADLGRTVALYDLRADMSLYGQAFLLLALHRADAGGQAARTRTLAQTLTGFAVINATGTFWEESVANPLTMNTTVRTTAVVMLALTRLDPQDGTLPNVVRWLMSARRNHCAWRTTQETAWAVLALTEYMTARGDVNADYRYTVNLNGRDVASGDVTPGTASEAKRIEVALTELVTNAGNNLTLSKTGPGSLYYTAHLNYYLPGEQIPALNRGIIVGRQYLAVDGQTLKPTGQEVAAARVGDYVQVKLTVVAPTSLYYVIVEDPLPAGFEAVDLSLKTASAAAQGPTVRRASPTAGDKPSFGPRVFPGPGAPYWSYWTHSEVRDTKVALFTTELPAGTYEYAYLMRASVAGQFKALPATAYEMYFPETFGRSTGALFPVAPAE